MYDASELLYIRLSYEKSSQFSRKLTKKPVMSHLHTTGKNKRRSREIYHILTEKRAQKRSDVLENRQDCRFWTQIMTTDNKWKYFKNSYIGEQWLSPEEIEKLVPKYINFDE